MLEPRQAADEYHVYVLERIDIEEDEEEQDAVEDDRRDVLSPYHRQKFIVAVPDPDQDREADTEGRKPFTISMSFSTELGASTDTTNSVIARAKTPSRERLDARHLRAADAEAIFPRRRRRARGFGHESVTTIAAPICGYPPGAIS